MSPQPPSQVTVDGVRRGVPTGYGDLDELLSGLQPATLNVVAGRPQMGKTAFALGIAGHVARAGLPVLFFSLDVRHSMLTQRLLASAALVDSAKMRDGLLTEHDWSKIARAVSELEHAPLFIDDNPHVTTTEIGANARQVMARTGRLGCVIVDYLQLISGHGTAEDGEVDVSEHSCSLKILARELSVPVVALSQLSRGPGSRPDNRPMLSDLHEPDAVDDADVVIFLYRDEVYNPGSRDRGSAEVIVAKHRNGPTGTAKLVVLPRYSRFETAARGI